MKGTTSTTVTIIIHQNKVQYYAKWPTSIYHQPLHNNKNKDATIYREISLAGMDKPWMIIFHSEKNYSHLRIYSIWITHLNPRLNVFDKKTNY